MKYTLYQIDAFADKLFSGNPAAVVPLKKWLPTETMQLLALENNLSETVFFVPSEQKGVDYDIRWFTPAAEINLCGHATLASAYVIFELLGSKKKKIHFSSKSGILKVYKEKNGIMMDFPAWNPEPFQEYSSELPAILGVTNVVGVYKNRDLLVEVATEEEVLQAHPDMTALKNAKQMVILTAPGTKHDFVSRFFAPSAGVDEDPVTGSAHSQLIPFWANKLGKTKMTARQLSQRGGELRTEFLGERVLMGGNCVFYMKGKFEL